MNAARAKRWAAGLGIAVLATALSFGATHYFSFLAALEHIAFDLRISHAPPKPQHPDIVIAALNEDTLSQFAYRSPIDRAFLADLLVTLEQKGARAIVLDVLLDQATEPAKDQQLHDTLRRLRTPLVVSYTRTESVVNAAQQAYLDDFVPAPLRGWANLATDPFDGTVRTQLPGEDDPHTPLSLSRKVAQLLGQPTPRAPLDIAWRARPDANTPAFAQYPAHRMADLPDAWIRDRIVMIGAVLSLTDRHRTPYAVMDDGFDGRMPGVLVQAHSLAQQLDHSRSPRPGLAATLLVVALFALVGMGIGLYQRGVMVSLVSALELLGALWVGAILGYAHGVPMVPLVAPTLSLFLALWLTDAFIGRSERRARQFIQNAFSRYVSPAVVDQLVANPAALSIHGERREVTLIFTDIADFTTLSEALRPEQLSDMLNAYLDGACQIILAHGGTVDKFIGDAVMAMFNAPLGMPDHAQRAVHCALALDAWSESFRKQQAALGIPLNVTRIGVHSGACIVGNFGSHVRMEYTALGDVVNTTARGEGANKYFGTRVCCTQAVAQACPQALFRPIGDVQLKGKHEAVAFFEPLTEETAAGPAVQAYQDAYPHTNAEDAALWDGLQREFPDDALIRFYAERIRRGLVGHHITLGDK